MSEDNNANPVKLTFPDVVDGKIIKPRKRYALSKRSPHKYPAGTPEGDAERRAMQNERSLRCQQRARAAKAGMSLEDYLALAGERRKRSQLTPEERAKRNSEIMRRAYYKKRAKLFGVTVEEYIEGRKVGKYDKRAAKPKPQPTVKAPPATTQINYDASTEYVFNGVVMKRTQKDALSINPVSKIAASKLNPLDTGYLSDDYWSKFKNPKIPGRRK